MTFEARVSGMGSSPPRKASAVHRGWWMVAISFLGLAFGQTSLAFLTLGVFMKPFNQEFGWTRGQVAMALSVGAFVLLFATPFVGRIIDRVGAKKILLPSMAALGVALCSMYFLTDSLVRFYFMFAVVGVVGAAANNVSYVRILSAWFVRHRGLSIGIASSGVAAGQSFGITLAQHFITDQGWRMAYVALGASVLFVGLPIVALFIKNDPKDMGLEPCGADDAAGEKISLSYYVSKAEALRMPVFWALIFLAFFMATALHGIQIHFVPLLLDAGLSPGQVTGLLVSVLSVGAIVGRVGTGFLFDRFFAPYVAIGVFGLPIIGLFLVLSHVGLPGLCVGAFFFGIGLGSESDVLGYFTSRYFGLKSMAELYGYIFGAFMAGSSAGPALYGIVQGNTGNYDATLFASIGMLLFVCVVCAFLPRFKDKNNQAVAADIA